MTLVLLSMRKLAIVSSSYEAVLVLLDENDRRPERRPWDCGSLYKRPKQRDDMVYGVRVSSY